MEKTGTTNVETTCDQCKKTVKWEWYQWNRNNPLIKNQSNPPMKRISVSYSVGPIKRELEVDLCSLTCLEEWLKTFVNVLKLSF